MLVSCARATRGRGLPSLDTRSGRPSRTRSKAGKQAWRTIYRNPYGIRVFSCVVRNILKVGALTMVALVPLCVGTAVRALTYFLPDKQEVTAVASSPMEGILFQWP